MEYYKIYYNTPKHPVSAQPWPIGHEWLCARPCGRPYGRRPPEPTGRASHIDLAVPPVSHPSGNGAPRRYLLGGAITNSCRRHEFVSIGRFMKPTVYYKYKCK